MAVQTEYTSREDHYNSINSDYTGVRNVQDGREVVEFHSKSLFRIWMNDQHVDYAPHWHSALEIIIPTDNIYTAIIAGKTYVATPGDILFIPSGEIHELISPESGVRFVFIMNITSITKLKGFSKIQTILANPILMNEESFPDIYADIYEIMVQVRNEYFNNREFSELSIQSLLLQLFVKLGENHSQQGNIFHTSHPNKQQEYVQRFNEALNYIDQHYTEEISLDFLATQTGFSKFHFSRLFKQYTNYNFSDYLCFRRIKAAEKLLETPGYSITDVAIESGFISISTFNRLFKQQKGCTPSEYRKQNNKYLR